ncbi:hypothetical protein BD1_61 [Octadecabacter Antarctic BD virus 1]|nr:hypothetical protein BD1_61 [Octadecabacter Antarctic BD virus 1]
MTKSFKRTATVEFAINGTGQTITVNNLPFIWEPHLNPNPMDVQGVFAAVQYLRAITPKRPLGLNVISVTTSPAPAEVEEELRDHIAEYDADAIRKLLNAGEPLSTTAAQFGYTPSEAQELLDATPRP